MNNIVKGIIESAVVIGVGFGILAFISFIKKFIENSLMNSTNFMTYVIVMSIPVICVFAYMYSKSK